MTFEQALDESDVLAEELLSSVDLPLYDDSQRLRIAHVACSLAFEHWHSARVLLRSGLLSSAVVVHRSQFESALRSVWLTCAATDLDISKLTANLGRDSGQAAKNVSQAQDMMSALAKSGPKEAHAALVRFKENSWGVLNSFVHAGIHPLRRHLEGYPAELALGILCNANGLAVLCGMQAVALSGIQPLQKEVLALAARHSFCMPPPL